MKVIVAMMEKSTSENGSEKRSNVKKRRKEKERAACRKVYGLWT